MVLIKFVACLVLLSTRLLEAESSSETLKRMSTGFFKALEQCKEELQLEENILSELYHYWKEDYELLNRGTGCAIRCMSKKLDLIDSSGKIHHGNAEQFAMKHGADSEVATKLLSLIRECEKQHEAVEDECMRTLEVAKCFRTGIHALNWAPKMDVIITEVLTEL